MDGGSKEDMHRPTRRELLPAAPEKANRRGVAGAMPRSRTLSLPGIQPPRARPHTFFETQPPKKSQCLLRRTPHTRMFSNPPSLRKDTGSNHSFRLQQAPRKRRSDIDSHAFRHTSAPGSKSKTKRGIESKANRGYPPEPNRRATAGYCGGDARALACCAVQRPTQIQPMRPLERAPNTSASSSTSSTQRRPITPWRVS